MSIQKTRVFRIFAALTETDRKEFLRFLRRFSKPKRQRIKAGFNFLALNAPAITEGKLSAQDWWQRVFQEAPFDINQLRKHQNKLTVALMDFMVEQKWKKEKTAYLAEVRATEQQLLLLSALWEHGMDALFASHSQKTSGMIAQLPDDHDRHALRYQLELRQISHSQKVSPFRPIPHFGMAQEALDHYYVISTLKLEIANRSQRQHHGDQPELQHSEAIQAVMAKISKPSPLALLYLLVLQLDDKTTYDQAGATLDRLFEAQQSVAPEAWVDLLYTCLNLAIARINGGMEVFRFIVLRIYLKLLHTGLLQRDIGSFKHNFINIMKLAFFRDPPEELARYVIEQKAIIEQDPEYKNAAQFYECQRLLSKGEASTACPCFMKVWFLEGGRNVRYAAGIFLIKTYYELGNLDDLLQFSTDFKRIISKDKAIDPAKKEAYRQFLKGMRLLCNVRFHGLSATAKTKLRSMEQQLENEYLMISKGWFQTQIEHLWKTKK